MERTRAELLKDLIVVVDCVREEAAEEGYELLVQHCTSVLLPFLERELESAKGSVKALPRRGLTMSSYTDA
jgi:hypothetical protein